jgi:hypothetical protein
MTATSDLPEPVLPPKIDEHSTDRDRRRRRSVVLTVATVVLVAVVALVIDDPFTTNNHTTAVQRLINAEVADGHERALTFSLSGSELITDGNTLQVVTPVMISGGGALDRAARREEMDYKVKVSSASLEVREVLSGKYEYIDFPTLTPYLPSGKTWVKVPAAVLGSKAALSQFSSSPVLLTVLRTKEAKVTDVGPGRVSGAPVEEYRVTLDRAGVAAIGNDVEGTGATIKPGSDVYVFAIDQAGTVRQVKESVVESKSATHVRVRLVFTVTHVSASVNVSVPRAREVDSLNAAQFKQLERTSQTAPPSLV